MRMLVELGTSEKRGMGQLPGIQQENEKEDAGDNFGMEDEDWDVYIEIQKDGYSEDEEND
jgi:hypothetical protein